MNELVEQAKQGNQLAFTQLIESMKEQLYKTAFVQLKNEQDALDAIQETLVKVYSNLITLRNNQFFKTWVIRILINECHNIHSYRSKVIPIEREYIENDSAVSTDSLDTIDTKSMLLHLDEIYRTVVDLRYNHDLKIEDISNILDIPVGTVKSRLNRAHAILRNQLSKKEVSI